MEPLLSAWLLGLVLGARHAFEPDHLAAVGTLLSTERRAALLGALWGAGHTATLLAVGSVMVLLRLQLPAQMSSGFELVVASMLLFLGARSILRRNHHHAHSHRLSRRPFFVGMAHGLAGSGALTALALASMPSAATALIYLLLFGLGSLAAMAAASGLLGWPLTRAAQRHQLQSRVALLAGMLSIATGLFWGWRSLF